MDLRGAAELQVLLEGVPLPASRSDLIGYAARERASAGQLGALRSLPERRYRSLDEAAEELVRVQPQFREERSDPKTESGAPPGGSDYTAKRPESGAVRDLASRPS